MIKESNKFFIKVIIATIVTIFLVVILIISILYFWQLFNKTDSYARDSKNRAEEAFERPKSGNLVFIRDGNIWISDFNGNNPRQITDHPDASYSLLYEPGCVGQPDCDPDAFPETDIVNFDFNDFFYNFPKVSYDQQFVAATCLSDETMSIVEEKRGEPQFDENYNFHSRHEYAPQYSLCIFDLKSGQEWKLKTFDKYGVDSLAWANNSNKLAVVYYAKGIQLFERSDDFKIGKLFPNINLTNRDPIRWSPDDKYIMTSGYVSAIDTLLFLNIATEEYFDIPENEHRIFMGDWLRNGVFVFPHNIAGSEIIISTGNFENEREEFTRVDGYLWNSDIELSYDKKYILYQLGDYPHRKTHDLIIRDLVDKNLYISINDLLIENTGEEQNIRNFTWLPDGSLIILTGEKKLWKIFPEEPGNIYKILDNVDRL